MRTHHYDIIIIGGGSAGSTAANLARRHGKRVALVEGDRLGGVCLNYGCDPTKTLLHAARQIHDAKAANGCGIYVPTAECDWEGVLKRVEQVIRDFRGGSVEDAGAKVKARGIDLYRRTAAFLSPHEIEAGDLVLHGEHIVIAVGSDAAIPAIPGLQEGGYITNKQAVMLRPFPYRLAILGGGPVGIEFAQVFARFGSTVTVIEAAQQILPKDDAALANELQGLLADEGIRFYVQTKLTKVEKEGEQKRLHIENAEGSETLEADTILVATGRKAPLEQLALDRAGVKTADGHIAVNSHMQTSVPHIYAAGDAASPFKFTHVASRQAAVAVENALGLSERSFKAHAIPWVTYTAPPLAHVGKASQQLEQEGAPYQRLEAAFADVPRARMNDQSSGRAVLYAAPDGKLLGADVLGRYGDEIIAMLALAVRQDLSVKDIQDCILPYPTRAQAVTAAAAKFEPRAQ